MYRLQPTRPARYFEVLLVHCVFAAPAALWPSENPTWVASCTHTCVCRYNDFYMTLFNILFTSLIPLAMGIFDRDVDRRQCIRHPSMYKQGGLVHRAGSASGTHACTSKRLSCVQREHLAAVHGLHV